VREGILGLARLRMGTYLGHNIARDLAMCAPSCAFLDKHTSQ